MGNRMKFIGKSFELNQKQNDAHIVQFFSLYKHRECIFFMKVLTLKSGSIVCFLNEPTICRESGSLLIIRA